MKGKDPLETTDSHESRQLARHDVQRGSRHEATDSRRGNELDEPAQMQEADAENDETADKGHRGRNLRSVPLVGMARVDESNDLGDGERHDGDRPNGHVLGSREELCMDSLCQSQRREAEAWTREKGSAGHAVNLRSKPRRRRRRSRGHTLVVVWRSACSVSECHNGRGDGIPEHTTCSAVRAQCQRSSQR